MARRTAVDMFSWSWIGRSVDRVSRAELSLAEAIELARGTGSAFCRWWKRSGVSETFGAFIDGEELPRYRSVSLQDAKAFAVRLLRFSEGTEKMPEKTAVLFVDSFLSHFVLIGFLRAWIGEDEGRGGIAVSDGVRGGYLYVTEQPQSDD